MSSKSLDGKKMRLLLFIFVISFNCFAKIDFTKAPKIESLYLKKYLSIVFANQNISSPVSMFGHTFLVAHNNATFAPDDISIEFLGKTNQMFSNHLKAIFSSITGEYKLGYFINKKREYNLENRDLWAYPLSLNTFEIHKRFDQLKQLISKKHHYTFLNHNCSYHILNLVTLNEHPSFSFYTLPKNTIRKLAELNLINSPPTLIKSDQSRLVDNYNELNDFEKQEILEIINGFDKDLSSKSTQFKTTLNHALNFKLPKERDAVKRHQYFKVKKKINKISSENYSKSIDPLKLYGDASFRLGTSSNRVFLETRFAQRDFFSSHFDGLANSYLDILKSKVSVMDNEFFLDELNIFKLESMISEGDFNDSFNRLIDLSFYRTQYAKNKYVKESIARFGHGISFGNKAISFGSLLFTGFRNLSIDNKNINELDLGVLTKVNYWVNEKLSLEVSLYNFFNTQLPYNHKSSFKMSYRFNNRFNLGAETTNVLNTNQTELSLIYNY